MEKKSGFRWPKTDSILMAATLLLMIGALFVNDFLLSVATFSLLAAMAAVAYNLLIGQAGQLSFGHAGFLAVGAYTAALLAVHADLPFLLALVAAMAVSGIAGAITGLPAVRVKGLMLALVTLAFAEIVYLLAGHLEFTGGWTGVVGIPVPRIGPLELGPRTFYAFVALVTAAVLVGAGNVVRSHMGRDLLALKWSEELAESLGVVLWLRKLQVFALAAVITGLAGGLTAYYMRYVGPESFTVGYTAEILAVSAITGFMGVWRVVPAAFLLAGVPALFKATPEVVAVLYALLLIGAVMIPELRQRAGINLD